MPATFNVDGFTSTIKEMGLANPNKFKVDKILLLTTECGVSKETLTFA